MTASWLWIVCSFSCNSVETLAYNAARCIVTSSGPAHGSGEQVEKTSPAVLGVLGLHRDELDFEDRVGAVAATASQRRAVHQAEKPVTMEAAQVELRRAGAGPVRKLHQHVVPQPFVAALCRAAGAEEGARIHGALAVASHPRGVSRFFFRPHPGTPRSCGGGPRDASRPRVRPRPRRRSPPRGGGAPPRPPSPLPPYA